MVAHETEARTAIETMLAVPGVRRMDQQAADPRTVVGGPVAYFAKMARGPAVAVRVDLASAAHASMTVALADWQQAKEQRVPAAKTLACQRPTGLIVKAKACQGQTGPAGYPILAVRTASGRLAQAWEVALVGNFHPQEENPENRPG